MKKCDICNGTDDILGVYSSTLGPFSQSVCAYCGGMGAESKSMIEATIECVGGIDNVRQDLLLTYYDELTDTYKDYRKDETIPIKFKDGKEYETKKEAVQYVRELEKKNG